MGAPVIFAVLTFAMFFALVWGAYWLLVVRQEQEASGAVVRRLKQARRQQAAVRTRLEQEARQLSDSPALDRLLRRGAARTVSLQQLIDQSGSQVSLSVIVLSSAVLGLLAFVLVMQLASTGFNLAIVVVLSLAAAAGAAMIPVGVLRFMRSRRQLKFEEQFPEALDLMARAMRAGHSFTTGLEMVADELPTPVGPEFRLLYDQQNYGMPLEEALHAFGDRMNLLDAQFFVTAVLIQRESGGNLAEILDNLAGVIRTRFRVKRQTRVISAHGRITGWILVCLPPSLFIVMTVMDADYRAVMFGTVLGVQMLVGALVLQVVGTLIIRKIINVEY
jgi:tight adherence protein B